MSLLLVSVQLGFDNSHSWILCCSLSHQSLINDGSEFLSENFPDREKTCWLEKKEQSRKNFECLLPLLFQSHLARWPEKRTILETQEDGACLPRAAEHKFLPFFNTRGKTNCSLDAPLQLQLPIRIHFEMTSSAWLSCVSITISKTLKRDSFPYFLFHFSVNCTILTRKEEGVGSTKEHPSKPKLAEREIF